MKHNTRWALTSLSLSTLMSSLDTSIANASLPVLAQAFGVGVQTVQWVVLAYLLAITTLIVTAGRLGDLLGRRRLLLAGIFVFMSASGLCGMSQSFWFLIAARAGQGIGAAIMMSLTMSLVREAVPAEGTGRAMGWLGTMSALGTTMGPSLGGLLIAAFGWRAIFLANVPLGLINLVLAYCFLPADRPSEATTSRTGFDHKGTLLLVATVASLALALTLGKGAFGPRNAALLLAAAAGAALFLQTESTAPSPLIPMELFRNSTLRTGLAMSLVVSAVMMSILVFGPFHLSITLGLDTARVGLLLSVGPFVAALTGVPAGRIVDRFGARHVTFIGLAGIVAGSLVLFSVTGTSGLTGYLTPMVFITASYALFQVANNTAVMSNIGAGQRGVIAATLSLSRNLGLITGASIMGAALALK